ncbi:MAG: polysaccharide deacetylase family protein [Chthoniobacterales bacterium]
MPNKSTIYRALVVSIHDVSPLTRAVVEQMLQDLAAWGVTKTSLLVIPNHHHKGNFHEDAEFCAWLRQKVVDGHEAVIHGYYHQRPLKGGDSVGRKMVTQLYTAGEGEFYDLEEVEAFERLKQAQKEFAGAGIPATGFVAPAWLLGEEAEKAVRRAGFRYTTRIGTLLDFQTNTVCRSQSLVYSVRAGWRRQTSLLWNKFLFGKLREKPLMRLGLHPPDYRYPQIWKQIRGLVMQALADREAIPYQAWVERAQQQ